MKIKDPIYCREHEHDIVVTPRSFWFRNRFYVACIKCGQKWRLQ